ncbi:WD repeat-containing protein RUP2 [Euphorbia lathyris]|uniref:WD repeat-containing protein RUP2 n=1 Tax=Euphorbia lathyris TaxID=212925 RepID=UPI003313FCA8
MGSFHWSKRRKSRNNPTTTYIRFREWAMKNLSDEFHPATRIQAPRLETEDHNLRILDQLEPEERARCEWDFNLKSVVSTSSSSSAGVSDALGVIEFDPSDTVIATGGIARKIRIYSVKSLLPNGHDVVSLNHANVCDYYICTPAKLSSLRWKPGSGSRVIASADYDGVVMEYDLERRIPIFERDEHGGRRVWSVDYSHSEQVIGASGSDDGTMQIWDPRCEGGGYVATVEPSVTGKASVCCVEFNPYGGSTIAVGCADRKAYVYDIRMTVKPLLVLDGHGKTVTYVRFVDGETLATAGIDGCLKLWNLNESKMVRSYKGHANTRSFVGLSVWRNGGLLGCGSENNQVFVYDKRWGEPIWAHTCEAVASVDKHVFVSSICWSQVGEDKFSLVAGGSDGTLQVFQGNRKESGFETTGTNF